MSAGGERNPKGSGRESDEVGGGWRSSGDVGFLEAGDRGVGGGRVEGRGVRRARGG